MPAESSLRPSEVSTHRASSAAAAWSFELRRVQRIGGSARRHRKARSTSQGHVTRTTLLRHPCRRSQADTTVDRGEANAPLTPFAGFGSPPLFGFMLSPSILSAERLRQKVRGEVKERMKITQGWRCFMHREWYSYHVPGKVFCLALDMNHMM